ncbi:amino acid ABC transporter substrate-binding protein [Bacillus sp. UMB0893]|nr:transporter substrate-binding domain-containing protein [Bacillus sp. UMB0893]PLR66257.1 amino acid ABC transporter substrate-binding protein [Bacillus sp. UMB0893]
MTRLFSSKKLTATLFLMAFAMVMAGCSSSSQEKEEPTAWDTIKEEGKLTVATSGTLYPTSYHDSELNELTGYEVEVVREMAKRMDLEVEFSEMAFDGMLTSIQSGKVDIAANDIMINEERKEKFDFAAPYKYSFGTAMVRKDDLSGIKTMEDLKGKKAAGEATTTYMAIAREYGAEEVIYDNATNDQYLRDVSTGRTDVILNDYYLQRLAIAAFPDLNIAIHPDIKFNPNNQGIIMKKGNTELKKNIDATLKEMHEDGTISEISKKFFDGADVSKKPDVDFE